MKNLSIYIHIPFCVSKCKYCDFISDVANSEIIDNYTRALINEINAFNAEDYIVDTIFVGGGTPSSLDEGVFSNIITAIKKKFHCAIIEFTVECNPNSLNENKLKTYISLGVNRISLGVQSLNDSVLQSIGRSHDRAVGLQALALLKEYKIPFSVDLMIGLPLQTLEIVTNDIDTILEYGAEHISCYSLILEENTPLYQLVTKGQVQLPNEDDTVEMYNRVYERLRDNHLDRYEVSNFGKPCVHNVGYWTLHNYAGFGVSAHSLIDNIRYYNVSEIREYIDRYSAMDIMDSSDISNARTSATTDTYMDINNYNLMTKANENNVSRYNHYILEERLCKNDRAIELVMLGLRMDRGVAIADIAQCGDDVLTKVLEIAHMQEKYLIITDTNIAVKPEYIYVENGIIEEFLDIK